ncbi:MAG: hypothetical protein MSG64_11770 [Pyrinomonadaceae bacterium MAG19_C2-C3]|nr:hypothetical protein [Pyrinomonadaceae bacterium MAG19_C2-C3]
MSNQITPRRVSREKVGEWLLDGHVATGDAPYAPATHHRHPWWQVMCLTGVDYFSTLGYQPGIAFLAAGMLSPLATIVLVLLTLFGALPIYSYVAAESPHGEGSISMLENLLSRWKGKLFVLCLLGFVATDFIITITLSAADATAHIIENPFVEEHLHFLHHRVGVTLVLIALLGAVFLKGFKEAIGIAVVLVIAYIGLNTIVVGYGVYEIATHPEVLSRWKDALFAMPETRGNVFLMIGFALLLFPKLALGLSGFETGVAMMPLVQDPHRIQNTRKLLLSAALIMSVMLIASSFVTTLLIEPEAFRAADSSAGIAAGKANGRALAYLAHEFFGDVFGTIYDISTILILWFAGASAMAGLLNIVPRYLPRYGMAPNWARATRPLAIVFMLIAFLVTILFKADVDAQGGAYATGVLVLMSSAAIAVTLSSRRKGGRTWLLFLIIALVFIYTTVVNVIERPEGIKIASLFILGIVATSLISRVYRTTELRVDKVELDDVAQRFIDEAKSNTIRIIANRCDTGDREEYERKEREQREDHSLETDKPILFFEVTPKDASQFSGVLKVRGREVEGYRVLSTESPAVPNAIAAFLLYLRNSTGKIPHVYFGWSEGNPLFYVFKYIAFGEGDTAPVTREVLRQAEPNPKQRPNVHVGG